MKVLILSSSNPNYIAGIVAKDLFESINKNNEIEATLLVREYDKYNDKNILSVDSKLNHFLIRAYRRLERNLNLFKFFRKTVSVYTNVDYSIDVLDQTKRFYKTSKVLKKIDFVPDAIIVLFMEKFVNYKNLYELHKTTKAPIYLYLMDMAPFTGGCHYAWDCKGFKRKCGYCPGLYSNNPLDQTHTNWEFKRKFIDQTHLEIICGSKELDTQVQSASLYSNKQIHNGFFLPINQNIYFPLKNKTKVKSTFDIPLNKKIIFFGANSVSLRRKGFSELLNALILLHSMLPYKNQNDIHLIIAGRINDKELKSLPFPYTLLGFLDHENLPKAFQAADIFASPSIQDSGPMMVNQSLMCGTPVVSFEVGVALDFVINGITGYMAKNLDSKDFAEGLLKLLSLEYKQSKNLSDNCRSLALEKYSIEAVKIKWFDLLFKQEKQSFIS